MSSRTSGQQVHADPGRQLERGPVRLRSALQFSLNIPAIKQTLISGLDHIFERDQDFGIQYQSGAAPVLSDGHRHARDAPDRHVTGYGTIANGGVKMPRTTLLKVLDDKDQQVWPQPDTQIEGERVISRQAAYIMTDILAGNTDEGQPVLGRWAVYDGKDRRPAAYKTGTTSDNKDVHAYGYPRPAEGQEGTGAGGRRVDGQQQQRADMRILSLDAAAPLWSSIMQDVSKDLPIASSRRRPVSRRSRSTPSPAAARARSARRP